MGTATKKKLGTWSLLAFVSVLFVSALVMAFAPKQSFDSRTFVPSAKVKRSAVSPARTYSIKAARFMDQTEKRVSLPDSIEQNIDSAGIEQSQLLKKLDNDDKEIRALREQVALQKLSAKEQSKLLEKIQEITRQVDSSNRAHENFEKVIKVYMKSEYPKYPDTLYIAPIKKKKGLFRRNE